MAGPIGRAHASTKVGVALQPTRARTGKEAWTPAFQPPSSAASATTVTGCFNVPRSKLVHVSLFPRQRISASASASAIASRTSVVGPVDGQTDQQAGQDSFQGQGQALLPTDQTNIRSLARSLRSASNLFIIISEYHRSCPSLVAPFPEIDHCHCIASCALLLLVPTITHFRFSTAHPHLLLPPASHSHCTPSSCV